MAVPTLQLINRLVLILNGSHMVPAIGATVNPAAVVCRLSGCICCWVLAVGFGSAIGVEVVAAELSPSRPICRQLRDQIDALSWLGLLGLGVRWHWVLHDWGCC